MSKTTWTKEDWRTYRRAKGIPEKANLPTALPKHIAIEGQKIAWMMQVPILDWSPSLFEDIVTESKDTTAPLFAGGSKKPTDDHLCRCGCKQRHNHAVSRVVAHDGPFGYSRHIAWYRNLSCRNKHVGLT